MFKQKMARIVFFIYVISIFISSIPSFGCTGIRLKAQDGSIVYARTMEFTAEMESAIIVVPRNYQFIGTLPSQNSEGLTWKSKYAAVGANGLHTNILLDGVNERGLAGGCFYFPGYAEYQDITVNDYKKTLAPWELLTWILTNFATVQEATAALPTIKVCKALFPGWDTIPPTLHFILHDATGACSVIEYVNGGEITFHNNVLGIITNAPTFDWHMTNLNNYINLSASSAPKIELAGVKLFPFGQGSGMFGLPGDFTPPSRFVRAVAFSQTSIPVNNALDAIHQAFHLLNQFDIPKGIVRAVKNDKKSFDYTQWTTASDLQNKKYYFHTFDNRQPRVVNLMKTDMNASKIITVSMQQKEVILDITPVLKK